MSREAEPSYEFGPFRLCVSEHLLLRDGQPVPLTPKVFDVLRVLVQDAGHLVEKDRLLQEVWPDSFVEEGALSRSVSVLRKALGDSPAGKTYIATVPTRGYRFVAPITGYPREKSVVAERGRHMPATPSGAPPLERLQNPPAIPEGWSRLAVGVVALAALLVGAYAYSTAERHESVGAVEATLLQTHRQVTYTGRAGAATLSRDGTRVAYVANETPEKKLMVQDLSEGHAISIFSAPEVGHLRWSPDGAELLMWARGSGFNGVYVVPQLGGSPRRIAAGQFIACWSPDGETVAVASYLVGKIWLRDRFGTEVRTLSLQGNSLVDRGSRLVPGQRPADLREQRLPGAIFRLVHPARRKRSATSDWRRPGNCVCPLGARRGRSLLLPTAEPDRVHRQDHRAREPTRPRDR